MTRLSSFCVLLSALALAGCREVAGPNVVPEEFVTVRATLSGTSMTASNVRDSVILTITVRNPHPFPVTLNSGSSSGSSYPWWTIVINDPDDPVRGSSLYRNAWHSLTLRARADTSESFVLYMRDAALGLAPGRFQVQGGLGRKLSAPLELTVTP